MKNKKTFNRQEQKASIPSEDKTQTTIPIHSYWFFSIMVIIASSMFVKHGRTEIQYNDASYILYFHHLSITISILLLIFGFVYWSQRDNRLTKWMTNFHSVLTLVIVGAFYMTCFQESTWNITSVLMLGIGWFVIAQIVLALNIWKADKE